MGWVDAFLIGFILTMILLELMGIHKTLKEN